MAIQLYTPGDTFGQFTDKFNNNASEQWYDLAYPSNGTLELTTLGGTVSKTVPLFTSMVISGMAITHPVAGDYLSIGVAAGTFQHDAKRVAFAGGTAAITAGDATYSRIDALVVDTAGVLSILTGTPAAIPVMPTPAANQLHMATIKVAPNADSSGGVVVVKFLTNVQLVAGTTSGQVPVWNESTQSYEPANIAGGMPASTQLGSMLVGDGSVFNEDLTVAMLADRFQLGQRFVELGDLGTAPSPSTTRLYQLGTGLYWGNVRLDNNGGTLPTGGTDGDVVTHNGTAWAIPTGIKLKKTNTTAASENLLLGGAVPTSISQRSVIIDPWAGRSTTGGGLNTLVGTVAGNGMGSSSQNNAAFGYNTGLTTGNFNTAIGSQAGNYGGTGNHNTWLGYMARAGTNASNTVALGSGAVAKDGGIAIGKDMNMTDYATGLAGIAANGLILGGGAYAVADKSIYPNPLLTGTNIDGNNLLIYGGAGTGAGEPGGLYFRLYNTEASGTTPQATPENLLILSKGGPAGANLVDIRANAKIHQGLALTGMQDITANDTISSDVVRVMVVADNTNIEATLPDTLTILDGHTIYVSAVGTSDYCVLQANSGQDLRLAGAADVTSLNLGWSSTARCMWDAANAVWWVALSSTSSGSGLPTPTTPGAALRVTADGMGWEEDDTVEVLIGSTQVTPKIHRLCFDNLGLEDDNELNQYGVYAGTYPDWIPGPAPLLSPIPTPWRRQAIEADFVTLANFTAGSGDYVRCSAIVAALGSGTISVIEGTETAGTERTEAPIPAIPITQVLIALVFRYRTDSSNADHEVRTPWGTSTGITAACGITEADLIPSVYTNGGTSSGSILIKVGSNPAKSWSWMYTQQPNSGSATNHRSTLFMQSLGNSSGSHAFYNLSWPDVTVDAHQGPQAGDYLVFGQDSLFVAAATVSGTLAASTVEAEIIDAGTVDAMQVGYAIEKIVPLTLSASTSLSSLPKLVLVDSAAAEITLTLPTLGADDCGEMIIQDTSVGTPGDSRAYNIILANGGNSQLNGYDPGTITSVGGFMRVLLCGEDGYVVTSYN